MSLVRRFLNQPWVEAVGLVLSWRLALGFLGLTAYAHILHTNVTLNTTISPLLAMWSRFDAGWYATIAQAGYVGAGLKAAVFFPLYPVFIRFTSRLTHLDPSIVGVALATLFTMLAVVQFQRLLAIDYHPAIQRRAIWYLLLSPMAVFLAAGYSEALFLLVVVSAFVAARHRQWWLAALFAALASATRLVGVMVVVPLLVEYFEQRHWHWSEIRADLLWLLAAPAGLLGYMTYLNYRFHDPLRFLHAYQGSEWPRRPGSLDAFWPFIREASDMVNLRLLHTDLPRFIVAYHETFLPVLALILGVVVFAKVRRSYGVFVIALLAVPFLSGDPSSLNRFTLPLFPIYIALALVSKNTIVHWWITVFSAMLLALNVVKFVCGYFVA